MVHILTNADLHWVEREIESTFLPDADLNQVEMIAICYMTIELILLSLNQFCRDKSLCDWLIKGMISIGQLCGSASTFHEPIVSPMSHFKSFLLPESGLHLY